MDVRSVRIAATAIAMFLAATVMAADPPTVGQDLKATIALQGFACDQVTDVKHNGDSDYVASCKDGNRYHVFVNAQGRVIVQKQ